MPLISHTRKKKKSNNNPKTRVPMGFQSGNGFLKCTCSQSLISATSGRRGRRGKKKRKKKKKKARQTEEKVHVAAVTASLEHAAARLTGEHGGCRRQCSHSVIIWSRHLTLLFTSNLPVIYGPSPVGLHGESQTGSGGGGGGGGGRERERERERQGLGKMERERERERERGAR